jgi:hypothetical protein
MSSDGARQTELFSDSAVNLGTAAVCGGGHSIVFHMRGREGNDASRVWRMDAGGANLKRLTGGDDDFRPLCSQGGKWVFYYDGKPTTGREFPWRAGRWKSCRRSAYRARPFFRSVASLATTGSWRCMERWLIKRPVLIRTA